MTHPHTIINLLGPHAQTTSNKASNECPFFSQTTVSTCYAISLQKVYKLSGKFIDLIECLTSFPRQGNNTLRSVHGIVEGWGGGVGWKSWGGGGGGGWLEVLAVRCDSANFAKTSQYPPPPSWGGGGGGGGWLEVLAVRCDSANFVKTSQYPPPPPPP